MAFHLLHACFLVSPRSSFCWGQSSGENHFLLDICAWSYFSRPPGRGPGQCPGSSNYSYVQVPILSDFPSSCFWVFPFPSTPCFLEEEPTSYPTSQISVSLSSVICLSLTFFNAKPVGPFLLLIGFPDYL